MTPTLDATLLCISRASSDLSREPGLVYWLHEIFPIVIVTKNLEETRLFEVNRG